MTATVDFEFFNILLENGFLTLLSAMGLRPDKICAIRNIDRI
jgi:hypothetical protein